MDITQTLGLSQTPSPEEVPDSIVKYGSDAKVQHYSWVAPQLKRLRSPPCAVISKGGECYKAYPGLGNRSIFYPGSSVGSTITFGIVEDTSSDPTSNISFQRIACACVLLQTCLPGSPGFGSKFWVSTYDRIRRPVNRYVPKIPPFQGGENVVRLLPRAG